MNGNIPYLTIGPIWLLILIFYGTMLNGLPLVHDVQVGPVEFLHRSIRCLWHVAFTQLLPVCSYNISSYFSLSVGFSSSCFFPMRSLLFAPSAAFSCLGDEIFYSEKCSSNWREEREINFEFLKMMCKILKIAFLSLFGKWQQFCILTPVKKGCKEIISRGFGSFQSCRLLEM